MLGRMPADQQRERIKRAIYRNKGVIKKMAIELYYSRVTVCEKIAQFGLQEDVRQARIQALRGGIHRLRYTDPAAAAELIQRTVDSFGGWQGAWRCRTARQLGIARSGLDRAIVRLMEGGWLPPNCMEMPSFIRKERNKKK